MYASVQQSQSLIVAAPRLAGSTSPSKQPGTFHSSCVLVYWVLVVDGQVSSSVVGIVETGCTILIN